MTQPAIPAEELAQLFRDVISGKQAIRLKDPEITWNDTFAGDVEFIVGAGWFVTFFNDCDELDYTECAVAPDGRRTEFGDWYGTGICCPLDLLTWKESEELNVILENAE